MDFESQGQRRKEVRDGALRFLSKSFLRKPGKEGGPAVSAPDPRPCLLRKKPPHPAGYPLGRTWSEPMHNIIDPWRIAWLLFPKPTLLFFRVLYKPSEFCTQRF